MSNYMLKKYKNSIVIYAYIFPIPPHVEHIRGQLSLVLPEPLHAGHTPCLILPVPIHPIHEISLISIIAPLPRHAGQIVDVEDIFLFIINSNYLHIAIKFIFNF